MQGAATEVTTTTTTQVLVGDNSNAAVREEFNREEFFGRREAPQADFTGGRLPGEASERDPYAVIEPPSGLAPVNARKHSFSSQVCFYGNLQSLWCIEIPGLDCML